MAIFRASPGALNLQVDGELPEPSKQAMSNTIAEGKTWRNMFGVDVW